MPLEDNLEKEPKAPVPDSRFPPWGLEEVPKLTVEENPVSGCREGIEVSTLMGRPITPEFDRVNAR